MARRHDGRRPAAAMATMVTLALMAAAPAHACRWDIGGWYLPNPPHPFPGETPPTMPDFTVETVVRAGMEAPPCDRVGTVVLSAAPDKDNLTLYYQVRVASPAPDSLARFVDVDMPLGVYVEDGRLKLSIALFNDLDVARAPLHAVFRITVIRRSGLEGETRDFVVDAPGRP